MCVFSRVPTATVADRTMTREQWAKTYSSARRKLRRVRENEWGHEEMDSVGSVKGCDEVNRFAVVKVFDPEEGDPETGRGRGRASFLTPKEEEEVFTALRPAWRPWTVFLDDGAMIQEACEEWVGIPEGIIDEAQGMGMDDIAVDYNAGPSKADGRGVIFDWGNVDEKQPEDPPLARKVFRRRRLATKLAHQRDRWNIHQDRV